MRCTKIETIKVIIWEETNWNVSVERKKDCTLGYSKIKGWDEKEEEN